MSDANQSPLEQVLRLCARQAPLPWYPRAFVRETGVSGEDLSVLIEHLLLDGLLERTPGTDATGPGLVLSQLGSESLNDPDALARLRKGLPLAEGDRGAIVREALSRIVRPYVSWALLAINILAFIYGILLASKNDAVQSFLTGLIPAADDQGRVNNFITLEQNGSLSAEAWLRGEWWRLLTCCFVHIGLLHILMNMYILYVAGGFLEQVWGRIRFLVIYLIAGVVGAGVGLAHTTTVLELDKATPPVDLSVAMAGASTALCGILAAEAVWVWLNGRYLPRSLEGRWRNHLMIQTVMIVFMSFFPGIGGWGHFGGAVGGALTAFVLNYQRFGPNPWRWVALFALMPISFLGYGEIQRMRMSQRRLSIPFVGIAVSDTKWKFVEEVDYLKRYKANIHTKLTEDERQSLRDKVEPVLEMDPSRREEMKKAEVQKALDFLNQLRKDWSGYLDLVNQAGPYYQPKAIKMRDEDREAIAAHLKLFEMVEQCLRAGKAWKPEEQAALEKQIRRVREGRFGEQGDEKPPERVPPKEPVRRDREDFRARFYPALKDIADAYDKLWDDSYSQVVRPPKERPEKVVEDRLKRLQSLQKQVTEAIGKLDEHGAYKDASTEKARETATALLRERTVLLALVEMALREGSRWTEPEPHIAHEHKNKAKALEAEWEAALEEIGGR